MSKTDILLSIYFLVISFYIGTLKGKLSQLEYKIDLCMIAADAAVREARKARRKDSDNAQ